jgi:hypothetical protein
MQIDSKNPSLTMKELSFLISRPEKMVRNNLKLKTHKKDNKRQIIKDLLDYKNYYTEDDYFNDSMNDRSIFSF